MDEGTVGKMSVMIVETLESGVLVDHQWEGCLPKWEKATVDALGGRSLLRRGVEFGDVYDGVFNRERRGMLNVVEGSLGVNGVKLQGNGYHIRDGEYRSNRRQQCEVDVELVDVVEVVEGVKRKVVAIVGWRYGYEQFKSDSGSGDRWVLSRGVVEIPEDKVKGVEDMIRYFCDKLAKAQENFDDQVAFNEEMRNEGLDDKSVKAARDAVLMEAGLDDESIRVARARVLTEASLDDGFIQGRRRAVKERVYAPEAKAARRAAKAEAKGGSESGGED